MKRKTFASEFSIGVALISFALPIWAATVPRVPPDWYAIPQRIGETPQALLTAAEAGVLERTVDQIFSLERDALKSVSGSSLALAEPHMKPSDWVPWRFVSFASDLSVSASGMLGVLGFKGTPSLSVYWQKRERGVQAVTAGGDNVPTFQLHEGLTEKQVESHVKAIHATVLASGAVRNSAALRTNLASALRRFKTMSDLVAGAPTGPEWYPSRLRADLEISASGQVKWGTVGGALRIRLEWFRLQAAGHPVWANRKTPATFQGSVNELIAGISEDLAVASASAPQPHFRAATFYVGLGLGARGNIGIARGAAQAFGYLYFTHSKRHFVSRKTRLSGAEILLIDAHPTEQEKAVAKHGTRAMAKTDANAFQIDRALFRAGLKKAMEVGDYFARRADANDGDGWEVVSIKPGFALSINGGVGLVTLTGTVAAQIDFQNQSF